MAKNKPKPTPKSNEPKWKRTRRALTPHIQKILTTAIAAGNHYTTACNAAGVREDVFEEWLDKGQKGHPQYRAFWADVVRAESDSEILAVDIIMGAAKGLICHEKTFDADGKVLQIKETKTQDWRAAAFILEHRFSLRWAALKKLKHSGALSVRQEVIVHDAGDPDLVDFDEIAGELEAEEELLELGEGE